MASALSDALGWLAPDARGSAAGRLTVQTKMILSISITCRHSREGGNPGPQAPAPSPLDPRLRGDDDNALYYNRVFPGGLYEVGSLVWAIASRAAARLAGVNSATSSGFGPSKRVISVDSANTGTGTGASPGGRCSAST